MSSSFLNFRSSRAGARSSSPSRDADDTADLFERIRDLEREFEREEDGSYSLVDVASRDGSRSREVESRRAYRGLIHGHWAFLLLLCVTVEAAGSNPGEYRVSVKVGALGLVSRSSRQVLRVPMTDQD